jgi:hypothetical protein
LSTDFGHVFIFKSTLSDRQAPAELPTEVTEQATSRSGCRSNVRSRYGKSFNNRSCEVSFDIRTVFSPYSDACPALALFAQEIAVFLRDNCSGHVSDDLIPILTEARVHVIAFAPHTTQVFQVLDLTLFGVLKRRPRYELPFDDGNAIVKLSSLAFPLQ